MLKIPTISQDAIMASRLLMDGATAVEPTHIIRLFMHKQPIAFGFVYNTDKIFKPQEREFIFYMGTLIWLTVKHARTIRQVTEEDMQKAHIINFEMMDMILSDTSADFISSTAHLVESHPEMHLLTLILDGMNENKDVYDWGDTPITDEHRAITIVHLKILLDALISAFIEV